MGLFFKYCAMQIRCKMQYRASFLLVLVSMTLSPLFELLGMYLLFDRFGNIAGFTFYEILFTYSVIYLGNAVAEIVFRGFDVFARQIRSASFDRLLVRPRSLTLQVLGSEFEIARIGRVFTSFYFLFLSISKLDIYWNPVKIILMCIMPLSAAIIYFGAFMLHAALCFWTIEGLEITNIFTHGSKTALQYPISIYNKPFRNFFTFIIPFALTNYYPMLYLFNRGDIKLVFTPLIAIIFIFPCFMAWHAGVRKYTSAGS